MDSLRTSATDDESARDTKEGMDSLRIRKDQTKRQVTVCRLRKDVEEICACCSLYRMSERKDFEKMDANAVISGTEKHGAQVVTATMASEELDVVLNEAKAQIEEARIGACNALANAGGEAADQITESLSEAKEHIADYGNRAMNLIREYHVKANMTFKAAISESIEKSNEALSETVKQQREQLIKAVAVAKEAGGESSEASGESGKKPQQSGGEVTLAMFKALVMTVQDIKIAGKKQEKEIAALKEANQGLKGDLAAA
ncbi:hypothetical protein B0A48_15232 [Cryoendolithus antarcticus]|uniref:Uncharacterized protein n=1 Tax=Cryoendolithus antarcticus TaxID=1507870 RepID=A0A1V8SIB5_9PEZI|nr:hypothetical protein B0A48_15232 [Cryoendolithus antarcticus]